jgi:hypothetical protein
MADQNSQISKAARWTGYVMGALPVLLMVFSGVTKLIQPASMAQDFAKMGLSGGVVFDIGIAEIACAILYVIPRTAVLGAILATGYLGGATFAMVRGGGFGFVFPVVVGVLYWGGLFLRDPRMRALIPLRRGNNMQGPQT